MGRIPRIRVLSRTIQRLLGMGNRPSLGLRNSRRDNDPRTTQRNPPLRILAYNQHANRPRTQTWLTKRPLARDQRSSPTTNATVQPLHGNSDIEPDLRSDARTQPPRSRTGRARPHGLDRAVHRWGSRVRS